MISKVRIYATAEGKAVPEGHKDARSLVVIAGGEISDRELARYDGAADLAKGELKEVDSQPPKTREEAEAILSKMNKAELIKIAEEGKIEFNGLNKDELVQAILDSGK